jgi:prolyl oligopeptidase
MSDAPRRIVTIGLVCAVLAPTARAVDGIPFMGPLAVRERTDDDVRLDAPSRPVIDIYWDTSVVDPYRNLEDLNDPEVLRWLRAQDARARALLEGDPRRAAIEDRLASLTRVRSPLYGSARRTPARTFFLEKRPPREQRALVAIDDVRDPSTIEMVLDPTALDPSGRTAIDFFVPDPNGTRVAVSLSRDGTEDGTLHVFDVRSGREIDTPIPRVHSGTAGGSVAWNADGTGFFYTRHPLEADDADPSRFFDQRVYLHEVGSDATADPLVLGEEFPSIAEIDLLRSDDGRHHLARVADGDGGTFAFWLRKPSGEWRPVAELDELATEAIFGRDEAVYFLSRLDAPTHQIVRMPIDATDIGAGTVVVPQSTATIEAFTVTDSRIYVVEMMGGLSRLRAYGLDGTPRELVDMGEVVQISSLVPRGRNEILFRYESFVDPPAWYLYSPTRRRPARTALVHESPASFGDIEVRRERATGADETEIPLTVLVPRGLVRDGHAPALLRGYGAYGISERPSFDPIARMWFDQGGVLAVANVRGGGEFGDEWHRAATLGDKKVSVDDFAACARHLVAAGYTSPDRLAIEGGSAGGLLVYATAVLYPERVAAALAHAGVADVLRSERTPNGIFNVPEFGTVEDETQFRGMYAYSPYHNVFDGERYPAVLSLVGLNDIRVEPWHALKMTARLIASDSPGRTLLRVTDRTGHGGDRLSDKDRARADAYTFLFQELDIDFRASDRASRDD